MNWAAITLMCLYGISLLLHANKHGQEKEGKENFWIAFIAMSINVTLLYFAGFFN